MKRILCFGDSNTYGHNPVDASRLNERWTRILPELLGDDFEIIEEGLCGRTTAFSTTDPRGWEGTTVIKPVVATHKPFDLMILMLGTNDLLLSAGADIPKSAKGLSTVIEMAKETYPDIRILLVSPIEIGELKPGNIFYELYGGDRARVLSKKFADAYLPVALKYHCEFMDAAKFAKASEIDGVHMDPGNHRKLAAALADKLREILG